jgi:hypothetical protein
VIGVHASTTRSFLLLQDIESRGIILAPATRDKR